MEPACPLINGHKSSVADIAFSPFDSSLMATAGGDCVVKCWQLPRDADGPIPSMTETDAAVTLKTHRHCVRTVNFHPTVQNLLTTTSQDMTIRLYDVSAGSEISCLSLDLPDAALSTNVSYNFDGSLMAVSFKDRVVRIIDPRLNNIVAATPESTSTVLSRNLQAIWCSSSGGQSSALLSVSAVSSGTRMVHLWDPRNLTEFVCSRTLDNGSGQLIPMFDESSGVCFIAGKGDTIVRYFECTFLNNVSGAWAGSCERGTDFQTNSREPIAGICMLPKRHCNVMNVEVSKLLKLTVDSVTPITFTLPRAEPLKRFFQDDVFGAVRSKESNATIHDWKSSMANPSALDSSFLMPLLESLKPAGVTSLSDKPVEVASKPSSVRLREEIKKEEDDKRIRNDAFTKLVSKHTGPKSFKVDSKLVDEDSDDNNWDD